MGCFLAETSLSPDVDVADNTVNSVTHLALLSISSSSSHTFVCTRKVGKHTLLLLSRLLQHH